MGQDGGPSDPALASGIRRHHLRHAAKECSAKSAIEKAAVRTAAAEKAAAEKAKVESLTALVADGKPVVQRAKVSLKPAGEGKVPENLPQLAVEVPSKYGGMNEEMYGSDTAVLSSKRAVAEPECENCTTVN